MSIELLMQKYQSENDSRSINILSSIVQYYKSKGESIIEVPIFDGKILDVASLFLKTAEKGGCPAEEEESRDPDFWTSIIDSLGIAEEHQTILQAFYMRYLYLYEKQLRLFKKKQQAQRLVASQQASLQATQLAAQQASILAENRLANSSATTASIQAPNPNINQQIDQPPQSQQLNAPSININNNLPSSQSQQGQQSLPFNQAQYKQQLAAQQANTIATNSNNLPPQQTQQTSQPSQGPTQPFNQAQYNQQLATQSFKPQSQYMVKKLKLEKDKAAAAAAASLQPAQIPR